LNWENLTRKYGKFLRGIDLVGLGTVSNDVIPEKIVITILTGNLERIIGELKAINPDISDDLIRSE
jgi:hypothetical protein